MKIIFKFNKMLIKIYRIWQIFKLFKKAHKFKQILILLKIEIKKNKKLIYKKNQNHKSLNKMI